MNKTTVHFPEELEVWLDAESAAAGVSKAELIRLAVVMLSESSRRPRNDEPLPVFHSGRSRSVDEMDDDIYRQLEQKVARR